MITEGFPENLGFLFNGYVNIYDKEYIVWEKDGLLIIRCMVGQFIYHIADKKGILYHGEELYKKHMNCYNYIEEFQKIIIKYDRKRKIKRLIE